ncbi:hypothetical protein EG329_006756 [Mollisiaceae sp. DMI_Dod_QoI]|nr:hypothetical protein EG329_006756 [Helotiales sp. DMI_Dod_QoI]
MRLITVSGTIGMGLFVNSGEILRIAGPMGGLMAYIVVGICVICVMDGVGEMIGHWPIANCMVDFVAKFVDKDLAIIVGIAYWYCYSITFATLVVAAADLASFWEWSTTIQDIMFTVGIPALLLYLNCMGVLWYANFECVLGFMKITLVLASFLAMVIINNLDTHAETPNGKIGSIYIDDGFQHDPSVASTTGIAVLVAIPIVAYAYAGVEIVAVTALEAKDPQKSLRFPAKWIAWLTFATYFLSAIGFYLNVDWLDPALPAMESRKNETTVGEALMHNTIPSSSNSTTIQSTTIVIIGIIRAKIHVLPGFINAGLILAVLSTSNTALYVSSRTLFGLTKGINPLDKTWGWLSRLSNTSKNKVPLPALWVSALAFFWVPFLRLKKSYSDQELQEIMSGIATVAVVIVWAALCLAFIRYRRWLGRHKHELKGRYSEYDHWDPNNDTIPFSSVLGYFQPIPAYIGFVFCLLIILVFATSSWWDHGEKSAAIWSAMAGPIILPIIWLILKVVRFYNADFEWYVKLGGWEQLQRSLDELGRARRDSSESPQRSARQPQEIEEEPLQANYPNSSRLFGATPFTPTMERLRDSAYGGSVSPTAGLTRHALGHHDMDGIELVQTVSQGFPSSATPPSISSIQRTSIPGNATRRKPVASVPTYDDRNSGRSMEEPMLQSQNITTQPTFVTPSYDEYAGPSTGPRRFYNELSPLERHELPGPSTRPVMRPQNSRLDFDAQDQDLDGQDARRRALWEQQLEAYDPALSPPSPQLPSPPPWDDGLTRKAVSEPDTGMQSQALHRQRLRMMQRERQGYGGAEGRQRHREDFVPGQLRDRFNAG